MDTKKQKVEMSKATDSGFDLVYIELTDIQRNLEESSLNLNTQGKRVSQIFKDIRELLNIKYGG